MSDLHFRVSIYSARPGREQPKSLFAFVAAVTPSLRSRDQSGGDGAEIGAVPDDAITVHDLAAAPINSGSTNLDGVPIAVRGSIVVNGVGGQSSFENFVHGRQRPQMRGNRNLFLTDGQLIEGDSEPPRQVGSTSGNAGHVPDDMRSLWESSSRPSMARPA